MWFSRAPARIDLSGGYTDVPPFCEHTTGHSVNFTVSLYTQLRAKPLPGRKIRIVSKDLGVSVEAQSLRHLELNGELDLAKSALKHFEIDGIEIVSESKIPVSSGMGSSGAYVVALVGLLSRISNRELSAIEIATVAARIEQECGNRCGLQDQLAAALGGCNHFSVYKNQINVVPVNMDDGFRQTLENRSLLVNIGGQRSSSNLVSNIMAAYLKPDEVVRNALLTLNNIAPDLPRAIERRSLDTVGELIRRVRKEQRLLAEEITSSRIEQIFDTAMEHDALCGKGLGGAGQAGCLLFLCKEKNRRDDIAFALEKMGCSILPFKICNRGLMVEKQSGSAIDVKQ